MVTILPLREENRTRLIGLRNPSNRPRQPPHIGAIRYKPPCTAPGNAPSKALCKAPGKAPGKAPAKQLMIPPATIMITPDSRPPIDSQYQAAAGIVKDDSCPDQGHPGDQPIQK